MNNNIHSENDYAKCSAPDTDPDSAISCKTACFMMLPAKHRIDLSTDSQDMTLPQPKVRFKEIIHRSSRFYSPTDASSRKKKSSFLC